MLLSSTRNGMSAHPHLPTKHKWPDRPDLDSVPPAPQAAAHLDQIGGDSERPLLHAQPCVTAWLGQRPPH